MSTNFSENRHRAFGPLIGGEAGNFCLFAGYADLERRIHAATSFLPFTGRGAMRGLMELPPLAVIAGIAAALVARCLHPSIGGCGVFG